MSARAIWKGAVVLGKTRIPVKLLSAVEERDVHFRLLHEKDRAPVSQRMVRPDTGDEVGRERIEAGQFARAQQRIQRLTPRHRTTSRRILPRRRA